MSSSNLMTVPWVGEGDRAKEKDPSAKGESSLASAISVENKPAPASQPIATEVRGAAEIEGDADEIEKYFASLMQRVGGGSKPTPDASAPAASKASAAHKASAVSKAPGPNSASALPAVTQVSPPRLSDPASPSGDANAASGSSPVVAPETPKELPPRRMAAEKNVDLQVLRDVANVHRLGAIDRHDCQSLFRRAYGVWAIGAMMGVLSLGFSLLPLASGLQFAASFAAFAASIVCTAAYWRMAGRHRKQVETMLIEGMLFSQVDDVQRPDGLPPS